MCVYVTVGVDMWICEILQHTTYTLCCWAVRDQCVTSSHHNTTCCCHQLYNGYFPCFCIIKCGDSFRSAMVESANQASLTDCLFKM